MEPKHSHINSSTNQQVNQPSQKPYSWYDKYWKILLIIPIILVVISLIYLGFFYSQHNEFIYRDVSLAGGTSITIRISNLSEADSLEKALTKLPDVSYRKLSDLATGKVIALVIESLEKPEILKPELESILGYELTSENSSIEFSGPSLSQNFYKQLIIAIIISFILMSCVIFLLFKSFIPSIAVVFAAFSDIIIPLAILDFYGIKLSAAGIAAFLMLIGYSVDTDILLTTRALKNKEGTLNSRIFRAFKTGIFMTLTALVAVLPAFFLITGLPDSFRQIFLILSLGLAADIINTWLTNAGIIKWYCTKKGIN